MTNTPQPPSLTDRWKAHTISQKTDLRAKLLDAVARHEGWEESAVAMVDEAIMPVLANHQATPEPEVSPEPGRCCERGNFSEEHECMKQPGRPSEIPDNKCPDCGATMIEVCSGLEINARGEAAGLCRHSDYCEKPIKPVSVDLVKAAASIEEIFTESGLRVIEGFSRGAAIRCARSWGLKYVD